MTENAIQLEQVRLSYSGKAVIETASCTIRKNAVTAVVGPSGSGKSSFLRAGLIPRLQRDDRNFVVLGTVRPGRNAITGDRGGGATPTDRGPGLSGWRVQLRVRGGRR